MAMVDHPSLNAPFAPPELLRPVANMDPYKPCWCGSGKKFKFCHYHRDRQQPINLFEEEQKMLAEFRRGYCSHPEAGSACSSKVTDAHTVQRRGGLAAIAEAGHVLTIKPSMRDLIDHEGTPPPRRIGVGRASVFPGFCNAHDSATFKPIEGQNVALEPVPAFLFAFRTIAYERFTKAAALRTIIMQREMDRGRPFGEQILLQQLINSHICGLEIGLRDIESWKSAYDTLLLSGDRNGFSYYALRFNQVLPLVGCGAFHPEYDFMGKPLQRLARRPFTFEHLSLSITAFAGQTVVFFGWLGDYSGPSGKFVASFRSLPDHRKADALIRLSFEQLENIYISPSWWGALGNESRSTLLRAVQSGTVFAARDAKCLIDCGSVYAVADVIESST